MKKKSIEIRKKHRNVVKKIMYISDERRHNSFVYRVMLPLSLNPKMGDKKKTPWP